MAAHIAPTAWSRFFTRARLLGALYDIPNIQYDGYRVLTNKPVCGAMRGHGTVNVRFAFETQLDELAAAIGMDPAEIRQHNLLKPPCITVNGLRVQSYGLPECIEKVVERSGWKQRKGKLPKGRGLGVACSHYVSGAANSIIRSDMPHSTVNIKIDRDGGVVVYTGASDIGQGSDTMVAQITAETLGCTIARVRVIAADTDLTPIDIGSYSSRVTFMNGNATLRAAQDVKKQIASAAARKMGCDAEELVFRDDLVQQEGFRGRGRAAPHSLRLLFQATSKARSCADRCSRNARTRAQRTSCPLKKRWSRPSTSTARLAGPVRTRLLRRLAVESTRALASGRRLRILTQPRWLKSALTKRPAR